MTTASNTTRVYVVEIEGKPSRLVRATYSHIAERHVIGTLVKARIASKDDLIELLSARVRLEEANEPEPAPPAVDPRQIPLDGLAAPAMQPAA